MPLIRSAQIERLRDARIGLINVSASGNSTNITTPLTTALNTAGDDGVSVPLQVATSTTVGVITTVPDNLGIVVNSATKRPIDSSGNEVYARLTESSGAYTLSYYTLVSGTQTAYSFGTATGIDVYFPYRFDFAREPKNSNLAISSTIIQQDPSASGGSANRIERLTVTATNTISALSQTPTANTNVLLIVNGVTRHGLSGGAFSVSGTAITWNVGNAGYSVLTSDEVIAMYW